MSSSFGISAPSKGVKMGPCASAFIALVILKVGSLFFFSGRRPFAKFIPGTPASVHIEMAFSSHFGFGFGLGMLSHS